MAMAMDFCSQRLVNSLSQNKIGCLQTLTIVDVDPKLYIYILVWLLAAYILGVFPKPTLSGDVGGVIL